ncbi:Uncharacterised protein [uncultured archaeon]|nr:Uncharacterised protein [uncultured archaeon]
MKQLTNLHELDNLPVGTSLLYVAKQEDYLMCYFDSNDSYLHNSIESNKKAKYSS